MELLNKNLCICLQVKVRKLFLDIYIIIMFDNKKENCFVKAFALIKDFPVFLFLFYNVFYIDFM